MRVRQSEWTVANPSGKTVREALRLAEKLLDGHGDYTSFEDLAIFYDNLGAFTIDIHASGVARTVMTRSKIGRKIFYWHASREDVLYVLKKLRDHLVLDLMSEISGPDSVTADDSA